MTDLHSTLDAIDAAAVHHCGHCDTPLALDAPSKYYCDDECQSAWNEARSEALVGYKEPSDVPAHVFNQVEQSSPEVNPWVHLLDYEGDVSMALTGNAYFQIVRDEVSWDGVRTIHEIRPISASPLSHFTVHEDGSIALNLTTDGAIADVGLRLTEWQRQVLQQVYGRHARESQVARRRIDPRRSR